MKRVALFFLLVPVLLWAQTDINIGSLVTVKVAETVKQPAGTIDRVSKRTLNSLTFEKDSIGSGKFQTIISSGDPLCYDSAGKMVKIDLSERPAKTPGYQRRYQFGPSTVEIDSSHSVRYEKNGSVFEVIPNAATAGIKKEIEFSATRMKETLIVDAKDPRHLGWQIKGDIETARRKIEPFTAWDASGKPVKISGKWDGDSLTVDLPEGKIWLDPTINDTASTTASGFTPGIAGSWTDARNVTGGNTSYTQGWVSGGLIGRAEAQNWRAIFLFALNNPLGINVDSVRFYYESGGTVSSDSCLLYLVRGTYTSTTATDTSRYNDISGWQASGTYAVFNFLAAPIKFVNGQAAGWYSALFSAEGCDTLAAHNADSLRTFITTHEDITGAAGGGSNNYVSNTAKLPYLVIYYTLLNPPGVSTQSDSLRPAVDLVVKVDSTGGANATLLTIKMWPKGATLAGDTITLTKSGSFGAGELIHVYCDSLPMDTLMRWQGLLTGLGGSSWTALDSFRTELTDSGETEYDTVMVTDTLFVTRSVSGRGPRKFEGR
jgi:hypothetical protein